MTNSGPCEVCGKFSCKCPGGPIEFKKRMGKIDDDPLKEVLKMICLEMCLSKSATQRWCNEMYAKIESLK